MTLDTERGWEGHTMVFTKFTNLTGVGLNYLTHGDHLQVLKEWMAKTTMKLVGVDR